MLARPYTNFCGCGSTSQRGSAMQLRSEAVRELAISSSALGLSALMAGLAGTAGEGVGRDVLLGVAQLGFGISTNWLSELGVPSGPSALSALQPI